MDFSQALLVLLLVLHTQIAHTYSHTYYPYNNRACNELSASLTSRNKPYWSFSAALRRLIILPCASVIVLIYSASPFLTVKYHRKVGKCLLAREKTQSLLHRFLFPTSSYVSRVRRRIRLMLMCLSLLNSCQLTHRPRTPSRGFLKTWAEKRQR